MISEPNKFYVSNSTGDLTLVEIYKTDKEGVTVIIGDKRYEFDEHSAYDLADALIMAVSDSE